MRQLINIVRLLIDEYQPYNLSVDKRNTRGNVMGFLQHIKLVRSTALVVLIATMLTACDDRIDSIIAQLQADSTSSTDTIDTTAPVITLNGSANLSLFVGETYIELSASATDDVDGALSITTTGSVDTANVGTNTITYSATDNAGNESTSTRTVVVQLKTPLNDTGITWGGNYPIGNNADCTGETIDEQDCSFGRDALAAASNLTKVGGGMAGFDFTKLDSDGNPLADQMQNYATQAWACVKDNHTGLVWEVKTSDAMGTHLHSMNDLFNWYNTDTATNGGADGFADDDGAICTDYDNADASSYCNTQAFVARVNASNTGQGLCGATDWRLPNRNELQSIAHLGKANLVIDDNYFPNSGSHFYWSSSPSASSINSAWGVHFYDGNSYNNSSNGNNRVHLVRSVQP